MCSLGRLSLMLVMCAAVQARVPPSAGGNNNIVDAHVSKKGFKDAVNSLPVNEKYPSAVLFKETCGGTIISPTWILTAAHCSITSGGNAGVESIFMTTWGRHVVAGTNSTNDGSGITRKVKRLVIHPSFSVGPYWLDAEEFGFRQVAARYDFLLAELSEPLPLDGKTMKAATLDDQPSLPVGLEVGYAGYGTDVHGGYMRSKMHGRELAIEANEACSILEQYESSNMLCAKGRPPRYDSACNGDSGSGLVDENGRVVGVVSWVQNDAIECRNGALLVFSRVAAVRDWIRQVTKL